MNNGDCSGIGSDNGRGHNITTYSGKPFYPLDPRPDEIRLDDIAHSLSMQCRFNGATIKFYSVAEHCVIMSKLFSDVDLMREALMHDAAEAYLGDLVRPVKAHCPDWRAIDAKVDAACRDRFGLPRIMSNEVKDMDLRMAVTERRDLLHNSGS
jgi:5'-deoxynucleotidase YfbR-like HD superfamily hydrolase